MLNCRLDGLDNKKPDLFIIDLNLKLKSNLLINKFLKKRKTYLITYKKNSKKAQIYQKKGYRIILIKSLKNKNDFILLYKKLLKMGYARILIETGLTFLNTLIKNKLINDLYIFKSDNILKIKVKTIPQQSILKILSEADIN